MIRHQVEAVQRRVTATSTAVRVDTLSPSVALGCIRHPHVHAHISNETVLEVIVTRPAA
jgi:hypothetical protein